MDSRSIVSGTLVAISSDRVLKGRGAPGYRGIARSAIPARGLR
jgi:hypothetical protein